MEHVVFFPSPDGAPAFRRVPTFEEAVRLVEHLRNVEGLTEVAVHPLGAEVPLAFRAWYRVEVPAAEAPAAEAPAEPAEPVAVPAVEVAPEPVLAAVPEQAAAVEGEAPADASAEAPAETPAAGEPVPVLVEAGSSNGQPADGVKSLGFFA